MNRFIIIVFLLVVLIQSTSKLWIVTSFYINRDYISKNLCENRFDAIVVCKGQCVLNKELKEKEQKEQNLPDLKQKETTLYFNGNEILQLSDTLQIRKVFFVNYNTSSYLSSYYTSIFHPPQLG